MASTQYSWASSSSKSLNASIPTNCPASSRMQIHTLKPHIVVMNVRNPIQSMWNQLRAPAVAARPKRISPIGGGNSLAVDPQATRSVENLGVGVNDARVIGNWRALRILPDSVAAAFSNWSDVAVISCDVPASSGSTRMD